MRTPSRVGSYSVEVTTKRRYDATRRRAAAEERRTRVATVAAEMFARRGWSGTTIAGVAAEAGVSPELVSSAFGGKLGLFMAAFRHTTLGHGGTLPEALAALGLEQEPDREVRLTCFVDFACDTLERMAPLVSVLALAADQDAELQGLVTAAELRHAETSRAAVALLAAGPVSEDAVDEVYVLTRAEVYLTLLRHRGWTRERYAAWLRRSISAALAPPVGPV